MIRLTNEKVQELHRRMADATGGDAGLRDIGLLDSALTSAFATFDGCDLYPTLLEKGARLGYALVADHAFFDGNKRIGMYAMLVFLAVNGAELDVGNDDIYRVGMALAAGEMTYEELLRFVRERAM